MTHDHTSAPQHYLQDVFDELDTIEKDLHAAALTILEHMDHVSHMTQSKDHMLQEHLAGITQSCAFHDLNGQRVRKIQEGLRDFVQYLLAHGVEVPSRILPEDRLVSGPSRHKDALTQEDVEALLNA